MLGRFRLFRCLLLLLLHWFLFCWCCWLLLSRRRLRPSLSRSHWFLLCLLYDGSWLFSWLLLWCLLLLRNWFWLLLLRC